jgi:diguanylate cyclase (GGDEF)-like protein
MKPLMSYWIGRLREHPVLFGILAGLAATVLLTAVHGLLEWTPGFRPMFVIPIWIATRLGGRAAGLALVLLCSAQVTFVEYQQAWIGAEALISNGLLRLASMLALMILIAHVEDALRVHQKMSLYDPLTGLLNRRAFQEFGHHAVGRAHRSAEPLVVVMIDCDDFKILNDTFGHQAGDHVLRILARTLEIGTRSSDLIARLGGDEFVVILQNTDSNEAFKVMSRIQQHFECAVRDAGYDASLSVGYAPMEESELSMDELLHRADIAMYAQKSSKKTHAYLN